MKRVKLTVQYSALQGLYWMLFCAIYSFATVFLLEQGFSGTRIGIIVALGNVLGVVLQPVAGALADNSERITVGRLITILSAVMLVVLAILKIVSGALPVVAVLFILADALLQILQPLVNSVSVYYMNRGVDLNFGIARGIGSVMYAVVSSVLGKLVAGYGVSLILYSGIIILTGMMIIISMMPMREKDSDAKKEACQEEKNILEFLANYKYFSVVLVGLTLLLLSHNLLNNYMIHIVTPLGGDEAAMGTAFSIAAMLELPTMFLFSGLVKRIHSERLLMFSGLFFFLKAGAYFLCTNMTQIYMTQIFQMGAFALYIPASVYYVNEVMEEQDKFKGQALMVGTSTLGGVFGGLLGGVLVDHTGVRQLLFTGVLTAFAGMALVFVSAGKENKIQKGRD
ncbi:MAG: MFS transporter [Eubacteriales bacterium]|nr:MFS transporter [Eubacteriales bacterium]